MNIIVLISILTVIMSIGATFSVQQFIPRVEYTIPIRMQEKVKTLEDLRMDLLTSPKAKIVLEACRAGTVANSIK